MRGQIVAEFIDKYGETRKLRQVGPRRIKVAKDTDTVSHKMNRVASKMIGAKIKERRIAAGLSLEELCILSGLVSATPKQRMWEIENALRQEGTRTGTLFALAKALNCEVSDLMPSVAAVAEMAGVEMLRKTQTALSVVP